MSGHHPFDQLRARMTPERRAQNAATTQALLAVHPQPQGQPPQEMDADGLPESEQPVVLASQRALVQRLPGVVRAIRAGDGTLARTDDAWQTLGLEEPPEA